MTTLKIRCFKEKIYFFSWNAGGTIFGYAESDLNNQLQEIKRQLKRKIVESKFLFITLGSAIGYVHNQTNKIVANCHKMPFNLFQKELTALSELTETWMETLDLIRQFNPEVEIIFTVSPVRHIKDGLIENNRSKARLFELIENIRTHHEIHYFPSYEIVMDELRDYRFYKSDGMHPNDLAIQYVWEKLKTKMMQAETQKQCKTIIQLRQMEKHVSLYPQSQEHIDFKYTTAKKIENFLTENPNVIW